MWFLFVEIFALMAISFAFGAAVTALALRVFLKTSETEAPDAEEATA